MQASTRVLALLLCVSAAGTAGSSRLAAAADTHAAGMNETHFGGCVLRNADGDVPDDVYRHGGVMPTSTIAPFHKALEVYGLKLAARDDIADDFMILVAQAITEMFPQDPGLDLAMQREVLANHYRHKALIPVPLGFDYSFMDERQWRALERQYSICDVIMQNVPEGQVMEVVEHILHYVTDIGLHFAYPDVWGIDKGSTLARAMNIAIENGYYDISGYADIEDPGIRFRVEMQEFAYWFISSAWDLQEPYGPKDEREWLLLTPEALRQKLPEMYAAYEDTAARIMVAPSLETLRKFGPTRAEESASRR